MPIEIRELIIKANIKDSPSARASGTGASLDKEAIVQDCVEQVMEILAKKDER